MYRERGGYGDVSRARGIWRCIESLGDMEMYRERGIAKGCGSGTATAAFTSLLLPPHQHQHQHHPRLARSLDMGKTSRSLAASGGPSTRGLVLIVAVCFTIGALLYFFYPFPTQPPIGMCGASFFCLLADLLANNLARFDPSLVADGIVRISTPYGIIRVRLRPDGAPNHVRTHTQSV